MVFTSVLSLSVSDLQTGFLYSWSGLDTDLSNLNLTIANVKRIALTVSDTLTDPNDPTTNMLTFYPPLDASSYLVPSTSLLPGRTYDARIHIRLDNDTILRATVLDKLNSIAPAQPVLDSLPGDNHVLLKFVGIKTAYSGSSPIEIIYVDVYDSTNDTIFKSFAIKVSSDSNLDKSQESVDNSWFYDITGLQNKVKYECQVRYENATKESVDLDTFITPSEIPSAPINVAVEPVNSGALHLRWSQPSDSWGSYGYNVAQYWIYRKAESDSDYSYLTYTSGGVRFLTDNSLTDGQTYSYKVRAVVIAREDIDEQDIIPPLNDGLNVGEYSDPVSSLCFDTTIDAPAFTVSSSDSKITVTLYQPTQNTGRPTNTGDQFVINFGGQQVTANIKAGTTETITYDINNLINYANYNIMIRYVQRYANPNSGYGANWSNNYIGNWSAIIVAMPIGPMPAPVNLASSPHLNLIPVSTLTEGKLLLTWVQPGTGVNVKYRIYREDGTIIVDNMNAGMVNNYTIGNLQLGVQYKIGVQSYYYYAEQNQEYTSEIIYVGKNITTQPFYYPSNAANLQLEGSDSTIVASWDDSANLNGGTNLRYRLKVSGGGVLLQTVEDIASLNHTLTGLKNGLTYTVVLSSYHIYQGLKFYSSSVGNVEDFLDQSAIRTPYSAVSSVTGLVSTPVDSDTNSTPLSYENDGSASLRLTWDKLYYDYIHQTPSSFSIYNTESDGTSYSNVGVYLPWVFNFNQFTLYEDVTQISVFTFLKKTDDTPNGISLRARIGDASDPINISYKTSTETRSLGGMTTPSAQIWTFSGQGLPLGTPLAFYLYDVNSYGGEVSISMQYAVESTSKPRVNIIVQVGQRKGAFSDNIRYRVSNGSNILVDAIQNQDTSDVVTVDISNNLVLGQQYSLDVQAYYSNYEEGVEKSSELTTVGADDTTQPFNYPTNGSNLSLQGGNGVIDASWNAADAKGGHDLKYKLVVVNGNTDEVFGTFDEISTTSYQIGGLTNGVTYYVTLSAYTTYLGVRYYSNDGGNNSITSHRTPYAPVLIPDNFVSTPLDSSNNVLSTKYDGKLNLSWDLLNYSGVFSEYIRYRILDENNNLLSNYNNITNGSVLVEGLVLGLARGLKVQAYFYNWEEGKEVSSDISPPLSRDNTPFCNPDDVSSLSTTVGNNYIKWSWTAGNGRGLTPFFEWRRTNVSSNIISNSYNGNILFDEYDSLQNGVLYNLNVKTYTEYTPFGATEALKFYATDMDDVVTSGVDKLDLARTVAGPVQNLKAYPQADKFAATFDAPLTLGGAELYENDDFYLSGYRYSIKNLDTQQDVVTADFVSKESELIVREPLTSGQRYELKVWAVTEVNGPSGVTLQNLTGEQSVLEFSYFVSGSTVAPDVHDLVITPGDSQLEVTFGFENSSDPNTQYEIIIYEVDPVTGALTDLNRIVGPNTESDPVDGVVSETLTNLTNNQAYKVVVLVSSLDNSGNRVYDSESGYGIPTSDVPLGVQNLEASNGEDGKTTVSFTAPANASDMPGDLFYQVVNKSLWNGLNGGIVHDAKDSLAAEVIYATNNVVYTTMVRAYYVTSLGSRVYGPFKTVQSLPLPEPEKASNQSAVASDEFVTLTWNFVSQANDDIYQWSSSQVAVKRLFPADDDYTVINTANSGLEIYYHNVQSLLPAKNGEIYEYKITLLNEKSVFANDTEAVNYGDQLVPSQYNSSVAYIYAANGNTQPFAKPLVSENDLSLVNNVNNTCNFSMKVSDNGRYVREVLLVGIPSDSAASVAEVMYVKQNHYVKNHLHPDYADGVNNELSDNFYNISYQFQYNCKSVLYIIENEAGNTVAAYPSL